ncbi:MAG: sulfite exporter TauE/SafE family protein [Deltaproteobacteria bacterium]|nr:sulfite exporter TauE/SafE family protein [Deltaproteobacteria bacterium]
MTDLILAAGTAFWLGILTSISPCPLATNIAAISFVGRRVDSPSKVFWAGLLYTIGRACTYVVLGIMLVASLLTAPVLSQSLQKYMPYVLGPLLILVGLVLLNVIRINFASKGTAGRLQKHIEWLGVWGALALGIIFALTFCPVSAALFFGSLLPLALQHKSHWILPLAYGIATGLPVLVFSFFIAFGARQIGSVFNKLTIFEKWARSITGVVFIIIGVYETALSFF